MKVKSNWVLFLIILFFFLKGIFLILVIPPWEAPDEPGHVAYVHYLYKYKAIPSSQKPFILSGINKSFIKSRTILKSIQTNTLKIKNNNLELFDRSETELDQPILVNLASHPPLYYIYLLPFYLFSLFLSSYWTLLFLRFGSLLLGISSLILIFFISKQLYPTSKTIPLLITSFVSLQPMFSFISSIVNKDILVVLAFLLFLLLVLDSLKSKKIPKNKLISLYFVTALSPLIVPQLLILTPLYFLVLYLKQNKNNLQYYLFNFSVLLPSIMWLCYKFKTEGADYLSYSVQNAQNTMTPFWRYPIEFIQGKQPIGIFMSFWGFFGWLDVPMPKWTYLLFFLFILLSLSGYYLNRQQLKLNFTKNKNAVILLMSALVTYSLSILLFDLQVFTLSHAFVIHGRYLAPILPLLIIFLVQGLYLYTKKIRRVLIFLVIVIFILNQIVTLTTINHHYYKSFFLPKIFLMQIYKN